ncbi:MAG: hypothetical protein N2234_08500 [Planctomycetota bacterium]|nr:hypothetical protein [Planctomycetota bacterium]
MGRRRKREIGKRRLSFSTLHYFLVTETVIATGLRPTDGYICGDLLGFVNYQLLGEADITHLQFFPSETV